MSLPRPLEQLGLRLVRGFEPERAHGIAIDMLRAGLAPQPGPVTSPRLATEIAGLRLANPVGLAAGFDKNATAATRLTRAGFGFVEVGAATPRPQSGNAKPRLFRLTEDRAVINRFGFNNDGMTAICNRLAATQKHAPVGLNLGANKDSVDRAEDYIRVLTAAARHVDFVTVNISSPNTEKLRELQGATALKALLDRVMQSRSEAHAELPVFLKIAPDLTDGEIADIAGIAAEAEIDAIIATNTTLDRPETLQSRHAGEAGGLSGKPLFEKSTRVLAKLAESSNLPLIGVGGISSADDAYAKIKAGASALQLYSALVYGGLSLVTDILKGLDRRLARDGHSSLASAIGTETSKWT